jgi:restriction system protein
VHSCFPRTPGKHPLHMGIGDARPTSRSTAIRPRVNLPHAHQASGCSPWQLRPALVALRLAVTDGRSGRTGADPGARPETLHADEPTDAEVAVTSTGIDLERASLDRIQAFIAERFAGHGLARLVGSVLEAEGFKCQIADPGADGGIDVFAGRGPLGLDSPRLIVQVKSSPTPVDVKVVRELHGVLSTHGAEQALLVACGGVNKVAKQELRNQFFKVRVWSADELIEALMRTYPDLEGDLRAELPLKQIWAIVEETE